MQGQQQRTNGSQTQQPRRQITDELDALEDILASSDSNPLLRQTDLGQGNYDNEYLWQQIRSYRHGLFAHIAFGSLIKERHIHETVMWLGRHGLTFFDEEQLTPKQIGAFDPAEPAADDVLDEGAFDRDLETYSSWTLIEHRGRAIWQRHLGNPNVIGLTDAQQAALRAGSEFEHEWLPIFWQMVEGRHEASRSLESTLMKYILGDFREHRQQSAGDDGGSLLPGR